MTKFPVCVFDFSFLSSFLFLERRGLGLPPLPIELKHTQNQKKNEIFAREFKF
jgi:hypothetical protein